MYKDFNVYLHCLDSFFAAQVDELLNGWDAKFCGTIDVGMGVWSFARGTATAVSHVGDSSARAYLRLRRGEFGDGPTRPGHALLLINPTFSRAAAVGQPWERGLRADVAAELETPERRWSYSAAPLPDDSLARIGWAAGEYEGSGDCDVSTAVER